MVSSVVVQQVLFWSWALAAVATNTSAAQNPGDVPIAVTESGQVPTPAGIDSGGGNTSKYDVSILKQIDKINGDGSYTFGYEASDGSFKLETRDVAGNVKGMFGFVDEAGRLKRVSYSANNSSSAGFRTTGAAAPPSSVVQTIPARTNNKDDDDDEPSGNSSIVGVKKVLVSKRLVTVQSLEQEVEDGRRGSNDLRRQLSRNDDGGDAPDVYGVRSGSGVDSAAGPVSPVVSALMAELNPIRAYRPTTLPPSPPPSSPQPRQQPLQPPTTLPAAVLDRQYTVNGRQAREDDESSQYRQRLVPVQYRQPAPNTELYRQSEYQQPAYQPSSAYQPSPAYPVQSPAPSTPVYHQQQQQPVAVPAYATPYGSNLIALRDELMELIVSFVQTRVSQLMSVASYGRQLQPPPAPYPMPYQQPNYYVPSYYQGPRVPGSPDSPSGMVVGRPVGDQHGYTVGSAGDTGTTQRFSPKVTQTLKDGLIRMLLSTSPRYDPEYTAREQSTPPRLTYRSTTQSAPVRSVQIIGDDDMSDGSSRPVTTKSPD